MLTSHLIPGLLRQEKGEKTASPLFSSIRAGEIDARHETDVYY